MFHQLQQIWQEGWRLAKFSLVAMLLVSSGTAMAVTLPDAPAATAPGRSGQAAVLGAEEGGASPSPTPLRVSRPTDVTVPIIMYHHTPPDFEEQLVYLEQHGYTAIDMDQALAGMKGASLPSKPVVITYDDSFTDQLNAFEILKAHRMKATFYTVVAGAESLWCIGLERRYGDPLQPPGGCGDSYMNWDDIIKMDRSGLITIAGHTFNHFDLTTLPVEDQRREIAGAKAAIERKLGHSIRHFAYPGGGHNDETVRLVQEAGFVTAVTTIPGMVQPAGSEFRLKRMRDARELP